MGDFNGDFSGNAVFNNMMSHITGNDVLDTGIKATNRSAASKRRLKERQSAMWIPRRCEFPGCDKTGSDELSFCKKCRCAFYCSVEHQKAQWPAHKLNVSTWPGLASLLSTTPQRRSSASSPLDASLSLMRPVLHCPRRALCVEPPKKK